MGDLHASIPDAQRYGWMRVNRRRTSDQTGRTEVVSYYETQYETTTRLEGLHLTWRLEIRTKGGFDNPALLATSRVFIKEAEFDITGPDGAFAPREAGERAARPH